MSRIAGQWVRCQVILAVLTWLPLVLGSEIKLREEIKSGDGLVYHDAEILRWNIDSIDAHVAGGIVNIPLAAIDSIDGRPATLSRPAPAPVAKPPAPPPAQTPAKPPVEPAGRGHRGSLADEFAGFHEYHRWTMDFVLLGAVLAASFWLSVLVWVQRDAYYGKANAKFWNALVLLLPGVGLAVYLVCRGKLLRRAAGLRDQADLAAAGFRVPGPAQKRRLLDRLFRKQTGTARADIAGFEFLDEDGRVIQARKKMPEITGLEVAREMLQRSITDRASDVHIEPHDKGYRVRFRIDGHLHERMQFSRPDGQRIVSSLKTVAHIDVAEKRKAQDGRFRVRSSGREIDLRVATTASILGEKMVLRILDRKGGYLSLGELGMSPAMLEQFDRAIHSRRGMILATGPTGSGKTSTLYAAISRLDASDLNIMTIEDPVEYELPGATQIPVQPKAGVTYESGLRSLLRQDPDVILVGEMRDAEAATIAIRAALTGHLVFSSLHTKDAIGAVLRLEELGIDRSQLATALILVVAQRLVRVLCTECREPHETTGKELEDFGIQLEPGLVIFRAKGCDACDGSGYQGRTGAFELLAFDDALRKVINDSKSPEALWEFARSRGFRSYREELAEQVLQGITSVDEVRQAG
jgi:general secretion pathway protein E